MKLLISFHFWLCIVYSIVHAFLTEVCSVVNNMFKRHPLFFFQSLLSHKYGYIAFPRLIEAKEFEAIYNHVENVDVKMLFEK